jgi:hypothetical protein
MRTLQYLITGTEFLLEANLINAGKTDIPIYDADKKEIEYINSFDKIIKRFLSNHIFSSRTSVEVRQWFERNFYKWIKRGAPDHSNEMMNEEMFQRTFYVPLEEYIDELLQHEKELVKAGKLSREIILNSFPDYVRENPKDAVVFSGGRLFRLNKIVNAVKELHDYILAIVQNKENPNPTLVPPNFMVKRMDTLDVPNAFKQSIAWHRYMEQQKEKVSIEKAKQLVKGLKPGTDYKVVDESDNVVLVQLKTAKAADVEGTIMKHCVASYGHDIEQGKVKIFSFREKESNVPVATMELSGKQAVQLKGPHNSTVKTMYHDSIHDILQRNKISVSHDIRNIGGPRQVKTEKTSPSQPNEQDLTPDET